MDTFNRPTLADTINRLVANDAPMLQIALAYAHAGLPVFPINPVNKVPLVAGGHHRATTAEPDIRRWWSQWPEAMPGIPMGPASGLWATEIDRRNEPEEPSKNCDGESELRRMGFKIEGFACRVRSGSGKGLHLVHKLAPGAIPRNRASDIAPGVDVRGPTNLNGDASNVDTHRAPGFEQYEHIVSGGYIVAAGAKKAKGGRYTFEQGDYTAAEEAPPELLFLAVFNSRERRVISVDPELMQQINTAKPQDWLFVYADRQRQRGAFHRPRKVDAEAAGYSAPIRNVTSYALRAFEAEVREVRNATKGTRNQTIFKAGCNLFELVKAGLLDKTAVSDALAAAARATGLDDKEIEATLSSAWDRVEPRDLSKVPSRPTSSRIKDGGKARPFAT
jgi:hypothetical protein